MLVAMQFAGFGAGGNIVQTLIPQANGTAIGDMTGNGGLAAAFDGVTIQNDTSGAGKNSATQAFIGKDWGAGVTHIVNGFKAWGASNLGFVASINPTVTATLQGSSDNFVADTNDLGNVSDTDANSLNLVKLTGVDISTAYRYHRLKITHDGATNNMRCAEVEFYEDLET